MLCIKYVSSTLFYESMVYCGFVVNSTFFITIILKYIFFFSVPIVCNVVRLKHFNVKGKLSVFCICFVYYHICYIYINSILYYTYKEYYTIYNHHLIKFYISKIPFLYSTITMFKKPLLFQN